MPASAAPSALLDEPPHAPSSKTAARREYVLRSHSPRFAFTVHNLQATRNGVAQDAQTTCDQNSRSIRQGPAERKDLRFRKGLKPSPTKRPYTASGAEPLCWRRPSRSAGQGSWCARPRDCPTARNADLLLRMAIAAGAIALRRLSIIASNSGRHSTQPAMSAKRTAGSRRATHSAGG